MSDEKKPMTKEKYRQISTHIAKMRGSDPRPRILAEEGK